MIDMQMLNDALFGYSQDRVAGLNERTRFAHYTSLDTAASILTGSPPGHRSFWLNNARNTNDTTEVLYGTACLKAALDDPETVDHLRAALEGILPGLWASVGAWIGEGEQAIVDHTYFISVARHEGYELTDGNLAMWGWYGQPNPVCFIFNPRPFLAEQNEYAMVFSPIFYGDATSFKDQVRLFADRLLKAADQMRQLGPELLLLNLRRALSFAVCSTKRPAFETEKEWRVLFAPDGYRRELPSAVETIRGARQRVYKIPLANRGDFRGASVPELIERIVVGPKTSYDDARARLIPILTAAGIPDPEGRIVKSSIPLV